jgi:hypothetical protein
MLHALLPTRLPIAEFYDQMARLWAEAIPLRRSLPLLLKFGLHGLPVRIKYLSAFLKQVRAYHLDY